MLKSRHVECVTELSQCIESWGTHMTSQHKQIYLIAHIAKKIPNQQNFYKKTRTAFCQLIDVEFSWSFMKVMRRWTRWEKEKGKEM